MSMDNDAAGPANPDNDTDRIAGAALAAGDPTGWFDRLYQEAADGRATVPWDRPSPSNGLESAGLPPGAGKTALVVGCGLGRDAEFVAGLGYATTAFDISPTAVRDCRARHPQSSVDYRVANLLEPPAGWAQAFDLVVESNTVQALPRTLRASASVAVGRFLAPGGTLLVLAAATPAATPDGPPWPLTRDEVESMATGGVRTVSIESLPSADARFETRWRAIFTR
jgi:SAM-dependent methyltransferase